MRSRAVSRADVERIEHQRMFLAALVRTATSVGIVLNPIRSLPFTSRATDDFSISQTDHLHDLIGFANAMRGVTEGAATTITVPIGGTGSADGVGEYITGDSERASALFKAVREGRAAPISG